MSWGGRRIRVSVSQAAPGCLLPVLLRDRRLRSPWGRDRQPLPARERAVSPGQNGMSSSGIEAAASAFFVAVLAAGFAAGFAGAGSAAW